MCVKRDKRRRVIIGCVAVLFLSSFMPFGNEASAASFDCGKAQSKLERRICADPKLSSLDDELTRVYKEALGLVSDAAALRKAQQAWLRKVRAAAETPEGIRAAYLARIEEIRLGPGLKRPMFAATAPPASVYGRYSKTEPLCFSPKDGEDEYDCSGGEVESYIDIRPGPGNAATVRGELWFFNGHACGPFEGKAEWVNGALRMPNLEDEEDRCVLVMTFKDGKVSTVDPGGFCKEAMLCGANAGFHGIELPKTKEKGGGAGEGRKRQPEGVKK